MNPPRRHLPPGDPPIERLDELAWWDGADAGEMTENDARAEVRRRFRYEPLEAIR